MGLYQLDKVKNPAMRKQLEESLLKIGGLGFIPNKLFFVCSVNGTDGASGEEFEAPKATIDSAIGMCTANKNDVIVCLPGHTETWTTTGTKITGDIAGVKIIGLGDGSNRPTLSFSHTGTTLVFSANNISIYNILFVTAVDQVVKYATISGNDFTMVDCEMRDVTDKEVVTDFVITGDRFKAINCFKNGFITGDANDTVFSLNGVDNAVIEKCRFLTKALTAIIQFVTAASSGIIIDNCIFYVNGTALTKNIVDTITGSKFIARNCFDMTSCAGFSGGDGAALAADDVSAIASLIGTLSNTGGTATLGGILGDVKNISMASSLMDGYKKTTIADGTTIPNNTQAAAGLLATATGGDVLIEEIIWQRGADNFVGPTNYEFSTDNVAGLTGAAAPNGVALLAKFNAAKTGILSIDGATKQIPFVLESTKALYIHGDDAATSAGGTTNFYIKYKRLAAGAYLA